MQTSNAAIFPVMVMKTFWSRLLLVVFLSVFLIVQAGCEMAGTTTETEPADKADTLGPIDTLLVGPTWQFVAFEETDGDTAEVRPQCKRLREWSWPTPPFFHSANFQTTPADSARTHSEGGCFSSQSEFRCMRVYGERNEAFLPYQLDMENSVGGGALGIQFQVHTAVNVPDDSKEPEFFDALEATTRYNVDGDRLRVSYGEGKALLFADAETFCNE